VKFAEDSVDAIKAKIAAKKAAKEKVVEQPVVKSKEEIDELLNVLAQAVDELNTSIVEQIAVAAVEEPVAVAAVEEPVAVAAETVLEELLVEVMSEREDLLPSEAAAIVESCEYAGAVMDELIAAASDTTSSPEEIKKKTEEAIMQLAGEIGAELAMNPEFASYTPGPAELAAVESLYARRDAETAKPVLSVKLGDVMLGTHKPHHTNKKGVYKGRR